MSGTRALVVLTVIAVASAAHAATLYVDAAAGNDAWSGLCATWDGGTCGPKLTIAAGIAAAQPGDEVVLADGIYRGDGNKDLDFAGKAITVRSASDDAAMCVIDCEGSGRGFTFHTSETADAVIRSLTIRNGSADEGGGMRCVGASPSVVACTFTMNAASQVGGGISFDTSSATLTRCAFTANNAFYDGGGLYCYNSNLSLGNCVFSGNTAKEGGGLTCQQSNPTLTNCTFTGNSSSTSFPLGGGSGALFSFLSSPTLANCILWGDSPAEIMRIGSSGLTLTFCNVQGGWSGAGNIDVNPRFAFSTDAHLLPGSPCIDSGVNTPPGGLPATDLDGTPRPLDGDGDASADADMGAYEFTRLVPTLALDSTAFDIYVPHGYTESRTLQVRNSGLGTLDWGVTASAGWLTATPASGTSTGEIDNVTLTVDATNLAQGAYLASATIDGGSAAGGTRHVTITAHVTTARDVPDDFPTIQAAIDAAEPGDHVVIADGVYSGTGNKNLDFNGKAITVRSASRDPNLCVIDCQGDGRGVSFRSQEPAEARLEGLTIRNASDSGVYLDNNAQPTISNCVITACTGSYGNAGGVECWYRNNATIRNCAITGNYGAGAGIGVACYGSNLVLIGCTIAGNTSTSGNTYAGGLYCNASSPTLVDCTIENNSQVIAAGGAVYCEQSNAKPAFTNCRIADNAGAGVVSKSAAVPTLTGCVITGNGGAGVACTDANAMLSNCLIAGNGNGGIRCTNSNPVLLNCTITANTAPRSGGVYCSNSSPTLTNCIVWGNALVELDVTSGSPAVTYSDIEGGWPGAENIDLDPKFAFAGEPYLLPGSSCVDAGTNAVPGNAPYVDLDGRMRTVDGDGDGVAVTDMGARELDPATPVLAIGATQLEVELPTGASAVRTLDIRNAGGGSLDWTINENATWLTPDALGGSSSGEIDAVALTFDTAGLTPGTYATTLAVAAPAAFNAPRTVAVTLRVFTPRLVPQQFATIQAAIAAAAPRDHVVLADGVYTGAGNQDLDFHGKPITLRSAGGSAERCVIDCAGVGRGLYLHTGETADAIIDGLTVRRSQDRAVYLNGASPTIRRCVIRETDGTALYCGSGSSPTVDSCIIADNSSDANGSAVLCNSSNPTLTNCTITNNTSATGLVFSTSGAVYCYSSDPTFTNCVLWGNAPRTFGIYSGNPVVSFCDIEGGWTGVGNLAAAPGFAFERDYHLLPGAPCVDAAAADPYRGLSSLDFDGRPRAIDGDNDGAAQPDIGAFELDPATPILAVSADQVDAYVQQESSGSAAFQIRNGSFGSLAWEVVGGADWLDVDPPTGASSGEADTVALSFDTTGLALGGHETALTVLAPSAPNGTRTLTVILHVTTILAVPGTYPTIQSAIDAANEGDVVVVADGTYTGEGNKDLDFGGKLITVRSFSRNPAACAIDCQDNGRAFNFHSRETAAATVQGLTIWNGGGEALVFDRAGPMLRECMIVRNHGVAVRCTNAANPKFVNCVVAENAGLYNDGGIVIQSSSSPSFLNCTIARNSYGFGSAAIRGDGSGTAALNNCILWNNAPAQVIGLYAPVVTYSDVQGGWTGAGNINVDPRFRSATEFHLLFGSPCIDAGNNATAIGIATDLDQQPRFVDDPAKPDTGSGTPPIVDLGAYEWQATHSGNCDGNGVINAADFNALAACMTGPAGGLGGGCDCADIEIDGDVDLADFAAFQTAFTGP